MRLRRLPSITLLALALAACGTTNPDTGLEPDAGLQDPTDAGPDAFVCDCADGYACHSGRCEPITCGDGRIDGDEICDDHDANGGDGCTATCTLEPGWTCTGTTTSACVPTCGDGVKKGIETCDDGDATSGDGCSATCKIETDCTCSGSPSVCSCAFTQTIWSLPQYQYVDTGEIVLDANGKPLIAYMYGVNFTDPQTGYSREHSYLMYGTRGTSSWTTSQVQTWDQTQTSFDDEDLALSYEGGTLTAYFQRIYHSGGSFAVGTRGSPWAFAYDNPYYVRDVVRGNATWHALADAPSFANLRYRMGAPGAWTRDEPVTGISVSDYPRLGVATNGDVYVGSVSRASSNASYTVKLNRRTGVDAWLPLLAATTYAPAVTGGCAYPVSFETLALPSGAMMGIEEGFDKTGKRWLRSHRYVGGSWVAEEIADLSWLSSSCTTGGASWTQLKHVIALDHLGQPHVMYPSRPPTGSQSSTTLEDHYRDATGWHVRTFPITSASPLDVTFDAGGTAHILTLSSSNGTSRLAYAQVGPSGWQ